MTDSLGKKTFTGMIWSTLERTGGMALQFLVNLILARLLCPDDFGAIGVLEIFIAVSQTILDSGFASALIQKKNPTQTDFSSVFYFNLFVSGLLYIIIFFSAPAIARYYHSPNLASLLRGLALIIITTALAIVQINVLKKRLDFRRIAAINISGYVIAAPIAIYAASQNAGPWALVILMVGNSALAAVIAWMISGWRPSLVFSLKSIRELFSFGGYMFGATILQEIARNLQGVIIGRRFSQADMGLYTQAYKLDRISSYVIPGIITQVLYPVFSNIKDDREYFGQTLRRSVRILSFLIFPLMAVLILDADEIIYMLYGNKWMDCVPYFQILCLGGLFASLQNINFYAVAAQGRSRQLFLWSIYKWGFLIAVLCGAMYISITAILWAMALSAFNIYMVNAALAGRLSPYRLSKQLLDILIALLPTSISFAIAYMVGRVVPDAVPYHNLIIATPVYLLVYLAIAIVTKNSALGEIKARLHR